MTPRAGTAARVLLSQTDPPAAVPLELFDPGPPQAVPQRPKGARSVAFGRCPKCIAHDRVGMVRTTTHLIWREHSFTTWAGVKMTCPASLVPVCQAHDRNKPRHHCTCERPLSARK